jgi:Ni/Fe-hydrogenase subunit HybB-like protein
MRTFVLNRVKDVFWILAVAAVIVGVARFFSGLGATTNMTDALPWGAWKIFNMVAGAALATGGFVVAAVIYVFQLEKYRPLARVSILIAFLGYGSSLTSLLFDIGLPWRFWHPFFMWNPHSFLFEVFWCVSCYWMVTAFEMLPIIFERFPWPRIVHFLHEIALPIIVIGITLSTMHHSSLGSLFIVSPTRLHPLWYTTWIPLEFFTSAMGAGMSVIVLLTMCYAWLYGKQLNMPVLTGMAKGSAGMLTLYFLIRAIDFAVHNKLHYVFGPDITWETYVFIVEIMLQVIIPVLIIVNPKWREKPALLFAATLAAALGLSMHRIDVGIVGYFTSSGAVYIPTVSELLLGLGIPAAAGIVFLFIIENYYVFEPPASCRAPETAGVHPDQANPWTLDELANLFLSPGAVRVGLVAIVSVPVIMFTVRNQALRPMQSIPEPVQPVIGMNTERTQLKVDGNRNGEAVVFNHQKHIESKEINKDCKVCHHLALPKDKTTACYLCHRDMYAPSDTFHHEKHQEILGGKKSCKECHDLSKPKGGENAPKCIKCHDKDMPGMEKFKDKTFSSMAPGYKDAMHGSCLTCHRRQGEIKGCMKEANCTGNCKFCHEPKAPEAEGAAMNK